MPAASWTSFGAAVKIHQSYAGLVISICNENGFSHWANCGMILDGWAAVCAGQLDRGMEVLREGVVGWQKGGARLWMPMFLNVGSRDLRSKQAVMRPRYGQSSRPSPM